MFCRGVGVGLCVDWMMIEKMVKKLRCFNVLPTFKLSLAKLLNNRQFRKWLYVLGKVWARSWQRPVRVRERLFAAS